MVDKSSQFSKMGLVGTQQILLPVIWMTMSWIIWEENWPNSCDLNPLDYAIWGIMENMVYKNLMRHGDIKGLSTAISDAWNRQTKKFINNSIDQWWMRLGGHIEHLIWQHWLMILRTFLSIGYSLIENWIW